MKELKDMPCEYVEHVKQVELRTQYFYGVDSLEAVVARFHDALEDGEKTPEELPAAIRDYYPVLSDTLVTALVDSITAITRQKGEVYMDYIRRLAKDPIARRVKVIDLKQNLYGSKTPPPGELKQRYKRALQLLDYKIEWWSGTEHK